MIQLVPQLTIVLVYEPVDFRNGIDGLVGVCRNQLDQDPFSGKVFLFRNRSGTAVKLLVYDGQGYWLSRTRQKTTRGNQIGGDTVTIIDPRHPLFGQTLLAVHFSHPNSSQRLAVTLADGRVRGIPISGTNAIQAISTESPSQVISVQTLPPLSRLICDMVVSREESIYDATHHPISIEPARGETLSVPPQSDPNIVESPRCESSNSTHPMPGRTDSAPPRWRK